MVKQRITLKLPSLNAIDTDNLILQKEQIQIPASVYLRRQDRLTLNKEEIPEELQQYFENLYQFRIQWSSPLRSVSDELFQNFNPKGLEINLVPSVLQFEEEFNRFNSYFSKYLPFQFQSENIISTATSATYHTLTREDITGAQLQKLITQFIPSSDLDEIDQITDIDIIWSAEDQQLVFKWISQPHDIILSSSGIRKELGLFQAQKFDEEDIELTGLTMVLQDQDRFVEPSNTLLIVKPRHTANYQGSLVDYEFETPIGLHPTLKIKGLAQAANKPYDNCELFLYSNIENSLIFDKFQYDEKTLQLVNTWGDNDLELPRYKIQQYGSIQLFQVDKLQDFEIKYHSRYLEVGNETNEKFTFLAPSFFWACDSQLNLKDSEMIAKNPFDSYSLGYESFFESSTNFYHLRNNQTLLEYKIPRGSESDFENIQLITLSAVVLGTLFLLYKITRSLLLTKTPATTKSEKKEK